VVRLLRAGVPEDPWNNPSTWPTWRLLLPHVLAVTDPTRPLDTIESDVSWLLDRAGTYLQARGAPALAQPLFEDAYDLRRRHLGTDHPDTLASASNLAHDLHTLGDYAAARGLDEDTYNRRLRTLGTDHPDTQLSASYLTADLKALRTLDSDYPNTPPRPAP
jgi:Tetratricopeptide repeat